MGADVATDDREVKEGQRKQFHPYGFCPRRSGVSQVKLPGDIDLHPALRSLDPVILDGFKMAFD